MKGFFPAQVVQLKKGENKLVVPRPTRGLVLDLGGPFETGESPEECIADDKHYEWGHKHCCQRA